MTTSSAVAAGTRPTSRVPRWVRPKTVFLALVLVVLAGYTEMALALEWRTAAGRIGPGFFPRAVGAVGLALTLWTLVTTLRSPRAEDEVQPFDEESGDADLGRHPLLLALMVLAAAGFVTTLVLLGTIISSALFLFLMLWTLNRGHVVLNLVLSVGLPVGLYLLLQSLLNAGLPNGILPSF